MVPDGGPYAGMAIRAVWKTKLDASVPLWSFTQEVPIKPEGHTSGGVYPDLRWRGVAAPGRYGDYGQKADADDALTVIPR